MTNLDQLIRDLTKVHPIDSLDEIFSKYHARNSLIKADEVKYSDDELLAAFEKSEAEAKAQINKLYHPLSKSEVRQRLEAFEVGVRIDEIDYWFGEYLKGYDWKNTRHISVPRIRNRLKELQK